MGPTSLQSFQAANISQLENVESGNNTFLLILEVLLMLFIVGLLTLSNIEGLSTIMVVFGIFLSWLFAIYFFYLKLRLQPEVVLFFAWIVWAVIGVFNVHSLGLLVDGLRGIFQIGVLLFLVAGLTAVRKNLTLTMVAIIVGGLIVALSSFLSGELQMATDLQTRTRIAGLTRNANAFAYHLLFVLFAIFYFWGSRLQKWFRIGLLAVGALSVLGIIYSGSRKMFAGVLVFLVLWYFYCYGKTLFRRPIYTFLLLISLAMGIYYMTTYVMSQTYLGQRIQRAMQYGDNARAQLYAEGFQMIQENPVFGVGLNNFRALSTFEMYSHSDYIEVASNTGVVGFVLYFSIYAVLWRRLSRIKRLTKDPRLLYKIGLLKASILTVLFLALGRPNITSKITWLFLASAIGFSWSIYKDFTSEASDAS